MRLLTLQLFKNSTDTQEKLRLNLHSLSVSELLEYGRKTTLSHYTRAKQCRQNLRVFAPRRYMHAVCLQIKLALMYKPKIFQIEKRNFNEKHSNLLFWDLRCLVCKNGTKKFRPAKFANFVYFCIACGNCYHFRPKCGRNFRTQYKSIQNSQTLQGYIFQTTPALCERTLR
jgi:hypothetical protein